MLKKIMPRFLFIFICVLAANAQDISKEEALRIKQAEEIMDKARIAVYGDKLSAKIDSVRLLTSGEAYSSSRISVEGRAPISNETRERQTNEILASFSGLARMETHIETDNSMLKQNVKINATVTVNGEKLSTKTVGTLNGQKIDIGKGRTAFEKIGANLGVNRKDIDNIPASRVYDSVLIDFYPFLLQRPNAENWRFRYIGQAKADGLTANVLELIRGGSEKENAKTTVRYFFDSKSNLLLMVTQGSSNEFSGTMTKVFYSEHKTLGGLVVPTKIKSEQEVITTKKMKIVGLKINGNRQYKITELKVDDFALNPKFSSRTFEIKEKKKK